MNSISLGPGATTNSRDQQDSSALYRCFPDLVRFSIGEKKELVYNPLTRARQALPSHMVAALFACTEFATIAEHAKKFAAQIKVPATQAPSIAQAMSKLAEAGLLVSNKELKERLATGAEFNKISKRISTVGIPTRNRPANLQETMESWAECSSHYKRDVEYLIADDSEDPSVREANRNALKSVKEKYGAKIYWAGPDEKKQYAQALAKAGDLPQSIVDFALLNPDNYPLPTGANRNFLLLSTVGEYFIHADDDVVNKVLPSPSSHKQLTLLSQLDPFEFWFDSVNQPVPDDSKFALQDVFALHEELLGKTAGACVAQTGSDVDLNKTRSTFFRRLEPSGGKVLVTAFGLAGDSGMDASNYLLGLDNEQRARLLESEEVYRQMLMNHRCIRATRGPAISEGPFCTAMNVAFDNTEFLPPFMPVQRNSDGIFAQLIRATCPGGMFGYLPWTVNHKRPGSKLREIQTRMRISDIIYHIVGGYAPISYYSSPEQNLTGLSGTLTEIGSLPVNEFERQIKLIFWQLHTRKIGQLELLLKKYGEKPDFWSGDVRTHIQELKDAMVAENFVVPRDLDESIEAQTALERTQQLILKLADLLRHWNAIREAARELKSKERILGEQI